MEEKLVKTFPRLELAEYLEKLAADLRKGTIDSKQGQWTIPEKLTTKIRMKEKKGRFEFKLKWRASSVEGYDRTSREAISRWEDSLKAVKKRLNTSYKALAQVISKGEFPDQATVSEFSDSSKAFAEFAEPEWQEAMNEYMDHLHNLKRAVQNRDLELMRHELRDLKNRTKTCHREFK
jgi:XXXCH domain-containing protein